MKTTKMKKEFIEMLPDKNICLLGLQGSRGQGLQERKDADYDYRGIWIANNEEMLSLSKPKETIEINSGAGDGDAEFVLHEVEKFFRLAIKGNPSIILLFFIPKYNIKTNEGDMIIKNKNLFLSESAIRNAFGGYAMSQILYVKRKGKAKNGQKISKHLKHCFRLLDQGQELLETGHITMPIKNPEKYFEIAKERNIDKLFELFEKRDKEFRSCKSVLPDKPDIYMANKLLLKIRGIEHSSRKVNNFMKDCIKN